MDTTLIVSILARAEARALTETCTRPTSDGAVSILARAEARALSRLALLDDRDSWFQSSRAPKRAR